ncbi:MAG: hypothetical protein OEL69_02210 [Nitrosopumilus sp.]|nr:hypothetical protein [Nitrosopumilus sp.]
MNELEYFRLLEKVMRESKKFGRVIVIVNKDTLNVENYSIEQIIDNLKSR